MVVGGAVFIFVNHILIVESVGCFQLFKHVTRVKLVLSWLFLLQELEQCKHFARDPVSERAAYDWTGLR